MRLPDTKVIPSRDLGNNYSEVVRVLEDGSPIIITNRGRGESVLIPFNAYREYEEYLNFRSVRERLAEAEAYAVQPDARWYQDDEFWNAAEAD